MSDRNRVVVGIDDSEGAERALSWAADEAEARHADLRVVSCYEVPPFDTRDVVVDYDEYLHWQAEQAVERAAKEVAERWPATPVDTRVCRGRAAEVLELTSDADLIVVGSRGLHRIGSFFLASVGAHLCATAEVPVVVVRENAPPPRQAQHVVVGVDGTAGSQDVLAFAFEYASRHRRRLQVVMCVRPDPLTTPGGGYARLLEQAAAPQLAEVMAGWSEQYPEVHVSCQTVAAHTVHELVERSREQNLLVVGKRRHRHAAAVVLGSVSQAVLHHAHCPVAVVPMRDHARPEAASWSG